MGMSFWIVAILIVAFIGLSFTVLYKIFNMTNDNKGSSGSNVTTIVDKETPKVASKDVNKLSVVMKTSKGDISLELLRDKAPITVDNFIKLAKAGFYDGTKFHRVIKDFMIQGGDPNSRNADWSTHGTGGPGYAFKDEFNDVKLVAGVLAMANSGPNTNGSQFFIVTAPATPWLDGKHTAFGRVTAGMDVVRAIENVAVDHNKGDHPLSDLVIEKIVLR